MPQLVVLKSGVNAETVDTLRQLLQDALAGRIVGIGYVAIHPGSGYSGDLVGRAKQSQIFSLGVARALEDVISKSK